jgi:hypothetical protein
MNRGLSYQKKMEYCNTTPFKLLNL